VSFASPLAVLGQLSPAELKRVQELFEGFLKLITRWNSSIKLVSSSDVGELRERHLIDSLAVVPHLDGGARLVDVGAGGGFPGVVIAIARPAIEVTSLEPIHKKHAFLATVRRELGLTNFTPIAERDEAHAARQDFVPYDIAISRATFAVPEWLERGATLVKPGGLVIAMEAREQHDLPEGTTRAPYPLGDRQRALLLRRRPPL
jgi:16S rRNA (guanine527-N7)-methyltransferase